MPDNENNNENTNSDIETTGGEDNVKPTINISIVNANELTSTDSPDDGISFIMVDKVTNTGVLLDYKKLLDILYGKLYSEDISEDSLKFYFVS